MSGLQKILHYFKNEKIREIDYLHMFPWFDAFDLTEKKLLAKYLLIRTYSTDKEIYTFQSPAVSTYLLVSGSVGIFKTVKNHSEQRAYLVEPHGVFGYSSLFSDKPRHSKALTLEKSVALVLLRSDFLEIIAHHPTCAIKLLSAIGNILCEDLEESRHKFLDLATHLAKANIVV